LAPDGPIAELDNIPSESGGAINFDVRTGLDILGVVDPTPLSDGASAFISLEPVSKPLMK
jgi:hypothetical protein